MSGSSDLRQSDWNAGGGRWAPLRSAFATLPGVRFQVLAYPETQPTDMGLAVEKVTRRETADKAELLLDIRIQRTEPVADQIEVPLVVVVNGVSSTIKASFKGTQVLLQAQSIPIDKTTKRGWGRVQLPNDSSPADNVFHSVFDEPPPKSNPSSSPTKEKWELMAAPSRRPLIPRANTKPPRCPPPARRKSRGTKPASSCGRRRCRTKESAVARQLEAHVKAGRSLLFLPPDVPDDKSFAGIRWTKWETAPADNSVLAEWWRSDAGLLAATRAGTALPVGDVEAQRWAEGWKVEVLPLWPVSAIPPAKRRSFCSRPATGAAPPIPDNSSPAPETAASHATASCSLPCSTAPSTMAPRPSATPSSAPPDRKPSVTIPVSGPASMWTIRRPS